MSGEIKAKLRQGAFFLPKLAVALAAAGLMVFLTIKGRSRFNQYLEEKKAKEEKEFEERINKFVKEAKTVKDEREINLLLNLLKDGLSEKRQAKVELALANLYRWKMSQQTKPAIIKEYAALATKYYYSVLNKVGKQQKKKISSHLAEILMEREKWLEAAQVFKNAENYLMSPRDRWECRVMWAVCLIKEKRYRPALEILSQVIEECDIPAILGKARARKADILLAVSENQQEIKNITGAEQAPRNYDQTLRDEAYDLYRQVVEELPAIDPTVTQAQLGMLRALILDKKKNQAYDLANEIQTGGASDDEKAEALIRVADMEAADGNDEKSLEIYDKCKSRYPETKWGEELTMKIYKILLKEEDWDRAFNLAEELIHKYPSENSVKVILNDFHPATADNLISELNFDNQRKKYLQRSLEMVRAIERVPRLKNQLKRDAELVVPLILFFAKDYEGAEKHFARIIQADEKQHRDTPPMVFYYDLLCAVNLDLSPVIVACRARRFLHRHPESKQYAEQVLQFLLAAYYQMGLYEDALEIAKNIFIEQLSKMEERDKDTSSEAWLKTVAKIGQCYDRLGLHDKANRILRNYARKFLQQPFAAQIYADWARVAAQRGQDREAIRRYDVAFEQARNKPELRIHIMVARALLAVKAKTFGAFNDAMAMLLLVDKSGELEPEARKNLKRQLYETLLAESIDNNPKVFYKLLRSAMDDFKDETWPEYWILRYFTPMIGDQSLQNLVKKHQEILQSEFFQANRRSDTFNFLNRQLNLIEKQLVIDETINKLQNKGP